MKRVIETIIEKENKKSKVPYIVAGTLIVAGVTAVVVKKKIDFQKELDNPLLVMSKLKEMHTDVMDAVQTHIEIVNEDEFTEREETKDRKYVENLAIKFNKYLIKVGDYVVAATNKYEILPVDYESLEKVFLENLPSGGASNE